MVIQYMLQGHPAVGPGRYLGVTKAWARAEAESCVGSSPREGKGQRSGF